MNSLNKLFRFYIHAFSVILLLSIITACGTEAERGSDRLFKSSNLTQGESFSYTFEEVGTVDYFCELHPAQMQATITVSESAEITERDTVEMQNIQFIPDQLTIAPNTVIVWINRDSDSHTVVSGNPSTGNGDIY